MGSPPPSVVDSEESMAPDDSTAPTTPDGSLSLSPELRPQDDLAYPALKAQNHSQSLSSALLNARDPTPPVRNICCVGAGFVGGPTAAVIALQNPHIQVTVVDRDEKRIRRWNSKHPPIYEPGLNDILRIARDGSRQCTLRGNPAKCGASDGPAGAHTDSSDCGSQCQCPDGSIAIAARKPNLVFTTEVARCISEADVVLIAVNTPTKTRGNGAGSATNMASFEAVTAVVAQHANPGAIIVEKSTVPCRTAQLVQDMLALYRPGVHFEVLSNPEFLAAGTAIKDLLDADRVLIGSSNTQSGYRAAAALASVYASWIPRSRIITANVFSSEMAKLVANSMLAQRISSINSIAALCDATGADVDEVADAIGADPRIGSKFLRAGIGFGGSCFKKDVLSLVYLAETLKMPEVATYWRAVVDMNDFARNRFVSRVVRSLNNTLSGKKVTVLGYAFKKDTNDTRESPALDIIRALGEEGPREIAVYDPLCIPLQVMDEISRFTGSAVLQSEGGPVVVYTDVYAACAGSDAVLITTEFDEFRNAPAGTTGDAKLTAPARPQVDDLTDPRPFKRVNPSESDLLALHYYLRRRQPQGVAEWQKSSPDAEDPLRRFYPMPPCAEYCPDCRAETVAGSVGYGECKDYAPKSRVDWVKIYYHMKQPHWVFDGRGVLDIAWMEKVGFRVASVGRQSRFGNLWATR